MADFLTPDLCVIGAGAGGLAVAELARSYGASVVLVEESRIGGSALNTGMVPTRALGLAAAGVAATRRAAALGIAVEEGKPSFRRLREHLDQVIASVRPAASRERLAALGIEVLEGRGAFIDKRTLKVGESLIRARRFVIATGASATPPRIAGIESVPYFTTDTIADNTRKLTHLVVIGDGPLTVELGQAYRRLGAQVTIASPGMVLPGLDQELAEIALNELAREGVVLSPHTGVVAIRGRSMGIGVAIQSPEGERMLDASHILIVTPRLPNLDGLDTDKAGLKRQAHDSKRLLLAKNGVATSNPRVLVIGDAAGGAPSAGLASRAARHIMRHVLLGTLLTDESRLVPRVVYTDPEIAEVGLSESAARTRHGLGFRVLRASYAENTRARAGRTGNGLAKLVIDRRGRILGASLVGPGAGELIALFALALANGLSLSHLGRMVAPDPSFAQLVTELAAEAERAGAQRPLLRRWIAAMRLLG